MRAMLLASTMWFPMDGRGRPARSLAGVCPVGPPTTHRTCYGGHSERETPGHIPNPEAKTLSADGTAGETPWESRTPPDILLTRPSSHPKMASSHVRTQREDRAWPTTTTARRIDLGRISRTGRAASSATAGHGMPRAAIARTGRRDRTSPAAPTALAARIVPPKADGPIGRTVQASRAARSVPAGRTAPTGRSGPSAVTAPVSVPVGTAPGTPDAPSSGPPAIAAGTPPALGTTGAPSSRRRIATTHGPAATTRRSRRTCAQATSTARRASS